MIYAVDIGSTIPRGGKTAFAWCKVEDDGRCPQCGTSPDALVASVHNDIESGRSVALGIEAPMFIPVPSDSKALSRGRDGEANRSWAAPAGGYVATLALHQTAWILSQLRSRCAEVCTVAVDAASWNHRGADGPILFLWEAFVSGAAHRGHAEDAATAAMSFQDRQADLRSDVRAETPISLLGAAVLWSGWGTDLMWLKQEVIVVRPSEPWEGSLVIAQQSAPDDAANLRG